MWWILTILSWRNILLTLVRGASVWKTGVIQEEGHSYSVCMPFLFYWWFYRNYYGVFLWQFLSLNRLNLDFHIATHFAGHHVGLCWLYCWSQRVLRYWETSLTDKNGNESRNNLSCTSKKVFLFCWLDTNLGPTNLLDWNGLRLVTKDILIKCLWRWAVLALRSLLL